MYKNFSRIVSVFLSLLLMLSFAGCTKSEKGDQQSSNAGSSSTSIQAASTSEQDKQYTLDFVGISYAPIKDDAPVKKYLEDKFNVKLNMIYVDPTKYNELMSLKFANNEVPDVFWCQDMPTYMQWVNQDVLAEIPLDTIRKYTPNIAAQYDDYSKKDKNIWNYGIVNGKNYGIGSIWVDGEYHRPVVWRTDWLKSVGIDKIPETIDEFETALYKFANEDPDKNSKKDTYGLSVNGLDAIYGISGYFPYTWSNKGGQLVYGSVQPEMKEVLKRLAKWYKDGVISPEFVTGENQGGYWAISHAFVNGKVGLSCLGCYYHWNPPYYAGGQGSQNYSNFKKIQGENATYDFGRPAIGADNKTGMKMLGLSGSFYSFGKQMEKDQGKMLRVLEIANSIAGDYDTYLSTKYGIKGTNWDMSERQEPVLKEEFKAVDALYGIGAGCTFMLFESPAFVKQANPSAYEFAGKLCNHEMYINELGTTVLSSSTQYQADLEKLEEEAFYKLISGEKPIDYFDEFVKVWETNGGAQLTKEANEWYSNLPK